MVIPAIIAPILGLINGPVFSIIDKLVPDAALKERLKAQISQKLLENSEKLAAAQRDVLVAEISGSKLTRSWRPVLMYVIMLFLLVYGLLLPLLDLASDHEVAFHPRWHEVPDGLWNLLSLGLGGYIGGRSVEKIAHSVGLSRKARPDERETTIRRHNNFSRN